MATERRLIDVNKVIDAMQKCIDEDPDKKGTVAYFAFASIIECLKQEPTVDAVEVVRCKDCKHCTVQQMQIPGDVEFRQFPVCVCEHPRGEVGSEPLYMLPDDFCSYGERRTDNE